jgi:hypothetical protein
MILKMFFKGVVLAIVALISTSRADTVLTTTSYKPSFASGCCEFRDIFKIFNGSVLSYPSAGAYMAIKADDIQVQVLINEQKQVSKVGFKCGTNDMRFFSPGCGYYDSGSSCSCGRIILNGLSDRVTVYSILYFGNKGTDGICYPDVPKTPCGTTVPCVRF